MSHFIIIKLCEAVNVKRLEIIGEQLIFSLKCSPFCNANSFCAYKVTFLSFIGYHFTIYNYRYFFIFWPVTNEPWAKICYHKWAMTELKSFKPFSMTGHCQKIILSPGGSFNNNEWGWVTADITLQDLHNSSYDTKAKFNNNCFIIHSK